MTGPTASSVTDAAVPVARGQQWRTWTDNPRPRVVSMSVGDARAGEHGKDKLLGLIFRVGLHFRERGMLFRCSSCVDYNIYHDVFLLQLLSIHANTGDLSAKFMAHPLFRNMDWKELEAGRISPPYTIDKVRI